MCIHILAAYFRGFHGDYQAELMRGDEVLVTKNLTLVAGQTTEITLAVPWYFKLSNTESQISFPRHCLAFPESDFPYNVYFQFFVVFCVFFRSQGLTQVPHVLDNCSSKVGVGQLPALLGKMVQSQSVSMQNFQSFCTKTPRAWHTRHWKLIVSVKYNNSWWGKDVEHSKPANLRTTDTYRL